MKTDTCQKITEQNEFERWYSDVYLPEQAFEPTQKEKAKVRFIFEEGLHYQKAKIDAANNRVCVWHKEINNVSGYSNAYFNTTCNNSVYDYVTNYCPNCGGKIEIAE
jgi:hypothetical protein